MTESGSLQLSDGTSLFLGGCGPWDEERVFWRSGYHPEAVSIPCLVTHFPPFLMPITEGWVLLQVRIPLNPLLLCLCWLQAGKIFSLPKPCDWIEFTYNLESFPYFTTDHLNSTCRTPPQQNLIDLPVEGICEGYLSNTASAYYRIVVWLEAWSDIACDIEWGLSEEVMITLSPQQQSLQKIQRENSGKDCSNYKCTMQPKFLKWSMAYQEIQTPWRLVAQSVKLLVLAQFMISWWWDQACFRLLGKSGVCLSFFLLLFPLSFSPCKK